MKCPNCGRDNPDIRLFCSRCGELLPESEEAAGERTDVRETDDDIKIYRRSEGGDEPSGNENEPEKQPDVRGAWSKRADTAGEEISRRASETDEDTDFFRRRQRMRRVYETAWPEEEKKAPRERIFDGTEDLPREDADSEFARPDASGTRRPPVLNRRDVEDKGRASTLIPPRDVTPDPDDFFAVRGHETDAPAPAVRRRTAAGDFEEPETQSFAMRHMRGIVAMILLAFTAVIVFVWACTPDAQRTLAQLDIAWKPSAYFELGQEAYDAGEYSTAGMYFSKALSRDEGNESYAVYAANSYIEGGYTTRAIEAVKELIALSPKNADYYVTLMGLYSGYEIMPDEDKKLIDEGYGLTGDERLNQQNTGG